MSNDFATQLTAVATLALAILALITAIFAGLAFWKQSREVSAIEGQVADEKELTRQQAELLKVQTGQLELLRDQLDEQRKATAAQAEVLALQAKELSASLEERKREADRMHIAQAALVYVTETRFPGRTDARGDGSIGGIGTAPPSISVVTHNTSDRPVYDAQLSWHRGNAEYGNPNPELLGTIPPGGDRRSERRFPPGTNMEVAGADLYFRDASGTKWVRRPDGYLSEQA